MRLPPCIAAIGLRRPSGTLLGQSSTNCIAAHPNAQFRSVPCASPCTVSASGPTCQYPQNNLIRIPRTPPRCVRWGATARGAFCGCPVSARQPADSSGALSAALCPRASRSRWRQISPAVITMARQNTRQSARGGKPARSLRGLLAGGSAQWPTPKGDVPWVIQASMRLRNLSIPAGSRRAPDLTPRPGIAPPISAIARPRNRVRANWPAFVDRLAASGLEPVAGLENPVDHREAQRQHRERRPEADADTDIRGAEEAPAKP